MALQVEISLTAVRDLEDIFDYTQQSYGEDQALKYVSSFDDVFDTLTGNPELGRDRTEIREGLRSIPKEQHIVFYRILENRIRIVRILHASKDLPRQFPDL